jgi:hypothetical protein
VKCVDLTPIGFKFGMVGGEDFGKKLSDLDYTRFHNVIVGSEVF